MWAYRGTFTRERAFFSHLFSTAFPDVEVVWTHDVRVFEDAAVRIVLESQFAPKSAEDASALVPPPVPYAVVTWNSEPQPKIPSMLVHQPDLELVVYQSDNSAQVWVPYMLVDGGPHTRDVRRLDEAGVAAQAPALFYVHTNCVRHREDFVAQLVRAGVDVVAGGVCAGHGTARQLPEAPLPSDDGAPVAAAGAFRLWLAAENVVGDDAPPGYLSEKLLNAFTAGTIPVFWGASTGARALFNPRAYVDVSDYPSVAAAVADVHAIVHDTQRLAVMHAEPVFQPGAQALVSWDPAHGMVADVVESLRRLPRHHDAV